MKTCGSAFCLSLPFNSTKAIFTSYMKNELNVDQIKKIWILDLIVKSGSLKLAASQAKITPSAVSQSLSSLEKSLGKPLIIRSKGEITPTQDALDILALIQPAFAAFEKLNHFDNYEAPKISWLNFGTYESIAVDILPGFIHRLRDKMPGLRLGLRIARTNQLLTMVRKGELCSAIVTEMDDLDRFYSVEVTQDRLGVFVSNRHPIAEFGWKAIDKFGLGSLSPGKDGLPRYYSKFLRRLDNPKTNILSESFEALRTAAISGAIASVLPLRVAERSSGLIEITPKSMTKDEGQHKILVVSQLNCDRDETNFLAEESRRLLCKN